eukprot:NODE_3120_length_452_cov_23.821538_g3070_i0.p2 GENE.NODE_3120_length_452_cov_23.821538_g3070_i0~~NODE_3120_length_452_cov_23.821538_g3070_i0.p2  ORF type:complete len:101 (-),score=19.53 NODE_3120_length_452_cov_23.821538_g3070_i0:40-342(-)
MVLVHVVLLKTKESASKEQVERMIEEMHKAFRTIPGVTRVTAGPNFTDRGKGYTHALVVELVSKSHLKAYAAHPEHKRVIAEYIKPVLEDILAIDYESHL